MKWRISGVMPGTRSVRIRSGDVTSNARTVNVWQASAPPPHPVGIVSTQYEVLFEDHFTGSSLDLNKWTPNFDWEGTHDPSYVTPPCNLEEWAVYHPDNVVVADGVCTLKIEAIPTGVSGKWYTYGEREYPYQAGFIHTRSKFTMVPLPGRPVVFEARVWIDSAEDGFTIPNWPAMWTSALFDWPTTGEIDILEGLAGTIKTTFIYTEGDGAAGVPPGNNSGWHVWSVRWFHGDKLQFFKDGAMWAELTPRGIDYRKSLSTPHVLMFGATLGVAGGPVKAPSELRIDWVRVWRAV